ncbi:type B 50S ribosomal protein L31 [Zobellia nedashkovskayae]
MEWVRKILFIMKKDIHPENYRLVAFKDMSNDEVFLTKSTAVTKETLEVDGVEYPVVKLEISRTSHPFYTGKAKLLDTAGRIDKFKNKYDKFKKKPAAPAPAATEDKADTEEK